MRKYLSTLRLGWLDAIEYRTEFFVSIFGWGFRLFIAVFLWKAIADAGNGTIGGYTFMSIMGYFFIVQTISSFVFSRVGFDVAGDIYRGDLANYMLKPINYLGFRFVHEVSKNAFRTVLSVLIFGVILFVFFQGIPLTLWKIPFAIFALVGAYIVNFCLVVSIALSAFWITNSTRLMFIYFGILTIFSGMMLPMDLFPEKFFKILQLTPFPYIFYFPAKVLQSPIITEELTKGIVIELAYIAILGLMLIFIFNRGMKHFESVGR